MSKTDTDCFKLPPVDLKPFEKINIANFRSWSQIELWCAINGIDVDFNIFKFFLCGIVLHIQIFDMMIDAMTKSESCIRLMNNIETIEVLTAMYDDHVSTFWSSEIVRRWIDIIAENQEFQISSNPKHPAKSLNSKSRMFQVLKIIDEKYPFLMIQYYDKHERLVCQYDQEFHNFILKTTNEKTKKNAVFMQILEIMLKNQSKYQKIKMFMN